MPIANANCYAHSYGDRDSDINTNGYTYSLSYGYSYSLSYRYSLGYSYSYSLGYGYT